MSQFFTFPCFDEIAPLSDKYLCVNICAHIFPTDNCKNKYIFKQLKRNVLPNGKKRWKLPPSPTHPTSNKFSRRVQRVLWETPPPLRKFCFIAKNSNVSHESLSNGICRGGELGEYDFCQKVPANIFLTKADRLSNKLNDSPWMSDHSILRGGV